MRCVGGVCCKQQFQRTKIFCGKHRPGPSQHMAFTKKRKYHESDDDDDEVAIEHNEHDVDISSALTTKKPKNTQSEEDEDEDGLANFIRSSIAKRSMKEGTKIVKKSKGKEKMARGEVGGGSFQSMGKS